MIAKSYHPTIRRLYASRAHWTRSGSQDLASDSARLHFANVLLICTGPGPSEEQSHPNAGPANSDALRAARGAQHCADPRDLSLSNADSARVILVVRTPLPRPAMRLSDKAPYYILSSDRPILRWSDVRLTQLTSWLALCLILLPSDDRTLGYSGAIGVAGPGYPALGNRLVLRRALSPMATYSLTLRWSYCRVVLSSGFPTIGSADSPTISVPVFPHEGWMALPVYSSDGPLFGSPYRPTVLSSYFMLVPRLPITSKRMR